MKQVCCLVLLAFCSYNVLGQNQTESSLVRGVASKRIVNGASLVSVSNYRFVVALRLDGFAFCGASVITFKHALTAAHCFDRSPPVESLTIYGGSTDQYIGGVVFDVANYVLHPEYLRSGINFDAAIVTVVKTFAGHQFIAPISLQNTEITLSRFRTTWCYIVGWGYTDGDMEDNPDILQMLWMLLLSHSACESQWGDDMLTPEMICTQLQNRDICSGDSGGPLVCNGKLTGVVSWGTSDCSGDSPAVFAKISSPSIRSFIRKITGI